MRRMLDPKTIGGGGGGGGPTAPVNHVYTIYINHVHYDVYTDKNYNFTIGQLTNLTNFWSEDNYKQLRAVGDHPASGYLYIGNDHVMVDTIHIKESGIITYNGYGMGSISYYKDSKFDFSQAPINVIQQY